MEAGIVGVGRDWVCIRRRGGGEDSERDGRGWNICHFLSLKKGGGFSLISLSLPSFYFFGSGGGKFCYFHNSAPHLPPPSPRPYTLSPHLFPLFQLFSSTYSSPSLFPHSPSIPPTPFPLHIRKHNSSHPPTVRSRKKNGAHACALKCGRAPGIKGGK